jgi:hypothetical protein
MILPPVPVYAKPSTVRLLRDLGQLYSVSMEEFTLTCMDCTIQHVLPDVSLPTMPPAPPSREPEDGVRENNDEAEAGEENGDGRINNKSEVLPSLRQDMFRVLFPQSDLRADLHRLSALIEEANLKIGQAKLSAEAFLPVKDYGVPKPPRRANPLPNDGIQYVMVSSVIGAYTLMDLEQAGPDASPLWGCSEVFVTEERLDFADEPNGKPQGLKFPAATVQAWLPYVARYGFVPAGTKFDGIPVSQTGEICRAFGRLVSHILETWCYVFQLHRGLPRQNLRADLEHVFERNRRIAASLQQQNLESEIILRSLLYYTAILTEAVQIIGSKARSGASIYDAENARSSHKKESTPIRASAYHALKARILRDLG